MNEFVDLRCLQHRSFSILHGGQNFGNFIVGFLLIILLFCMLLLPIISLMLFGR